MSGACGGEPSRSSWSPDGPGAKLPTGWTRQAKGQTSCTVHPPMLSLLARSLEFGFYAERTVMRSCERNGAPARGEDGRTTPHNQRPFRVGLSDSSSLSGARKRPRRRFGGSTFSMASSFALGSARV